MVFLLLGYMGAAAGFYFIIAKTAKFEPEMVAASSLAPRIAAVIELAEHTEKRAA